MGATASIEWEGERDRVMKIYNSTDLKYHRVAQFLSLKHWNNCAKIIESINLHSGSLLQFTDAFFLNKTILFYTKKSSLFTVKCNKINVCDIDAKLQRHVYVIKHK